MKFITFIVIVGIWVVWQSFRKRCDCLWNHSICSAGVNKIKKKIARSYCSWILDSILIMESHFPIVFSLKLFKIFLLLTQKGSWNHYGRLINILSLFLCLRSIPDCVFGYLFELESESTKWFDCFDWSCCSCYWSHTNRMTQISWSKNI